MEDLRLNKLMWVMVMMMVIVVKLGKSELIYVGGGKASWKPNVNLIEWASHEQFYVGDWLCKFSFLPFLSLVLFLHSYMFG